MFKSNLPESRAIFVQSMIAGAAFACSAYLMLNHELPTSLSNREDFVTGGSLATFLIAFLFSTQIGHNELHRRTSVTN